MTREEAIKDIQDNILPVVGGKSLVMAIEALKQPEPCEDAVNRKWLLEAVEEGRIKFDTEEDYNRYIHLVRDIAPSAQPENVKCKKCRYVYYDKEFGNYWCNRKPDSFMVEENGYCKWGGV